MKKELTIGDRVDLLLEHGTQNPKKWATVHRYQEPRWPDGMAITPPESGNGWAIEWRRLREHHLEETKFLFEIIDELRKRLTSEKQDNE